MGVFGKKKTATSSIAPLVHSDKISSATIITSCMNVMGDFKGTDTMHIDGTIVGNIAVTNTLVIGRSGIVEGNIEAKNVIINGTLKGTVKCDNLEVLQTGKVSQHIEAINLVLDGAIEGEILASESIQVLENSTIEARLMKSKKISVHGTIHGTVIATEILEIGTKGFVEGQITVKNIRTEEGGRMIGTMSTYQEEVKTPAKKTPVKGKQPASSPKNEEKEDDFFDSK